MTGMLDHYSTQWLRAGHGEKRAVVEQLADQMGVSAATAYRRLKEATQGLKRRKRRCDAGGSTLTYEEAQLIACTVEETRRKTGTGTLPIEETVALLRANGMLRAGRVDEETGEFFPLSVSAIRRAMKKHGFDAKALATSTPATRLSSPHPNYCWQVDASVSRQFYLADSGTHQMDKQVYYSGKPHNFSKIEHRRIWRYVVTDHCTGCLEVFYVQGAESAANLIATLIHVMTWREDGTMHGVPKYLMSDPGSGMKNSTVRNYCRALAIEQLINEVGNARAKGQVEQAHHMVETHFEATLKLTDPVTSIAEINDMAQRWARGFNATKVHGRTQLTRRDGWLRIKREQLILAPPVEVLMHLAHAKPKRCVVRDCLIRFGGRTFDMRRYPGDLVNGQKVMVAKNALDDDTVRVVMFGDEGQEQHYLAPVIGVNEWGFLDTAAQIGTQHKAMPKTAHEVRRDALDQLAMDAQDKDEAAARRKAGALAFGGRVDPLKHVDELNVPTHVPRAGVAGDIAFPEVLADRKISPEFRREFPPVSHVEAARRIKPLVERAGKEWTGTFYQQLVERFPDGVPVDQIEDLARDFSTPPRGGLQVIEGGAK